jgi:protein SCO1/2
MAEDMGYSEQKIASMWRIVLVSISLIFLFAACKNEVKEIQLPYYNKPDFTPIFLHQGEDPMIEIPHTIGGFALTNQHGMKVENSMLKNKIHVANFFFTGCGSICPSMMEKMKKVNKSFYNDSNVVFLSYSVTPWRDSVQRLKEYAETNDIKASNWHLLTGDKSEIYQLARRSYFAEEQLGFTKDSTDFLHTEHVLLVDRGGRIRGVYNGTMALDMEQLSADIKTLTNEKK